MLVNAWEHALMALQNFLQRGGKADVVLEKSLHGLDGETRARAHALYFGCVRHYGRISSLVAAFSKHSPRGLTAAILYLGLAECLMSPPEKLPAVIDFTVEQAKKLVSPAEVKFINALLRRASEQLSFQPVPDNLSDIAAYYSHPEWLVERWWNEWGKNESIKLLEWNQDVPSNYIRLERGNKVPDEFRPTQWQYFYEFTGSRIDSLHSLLETACAYIQDPSTRLSVEKLKPESGESVLDLCASPGGKARQIAGRMSDSGSLLACLELPGKRIKRLEENLKPVKHINWKIIEKDLRKLSSEDFTCQGLPAVYDAILLDAPCSNTGVIQRRPDVKLRLKPETPAEMARLQLDLLQHAAGFLKEGGRLVYSTCSIEPEENEGVIDDFLQNTSGFELESGQRYLPTQYGHDGAGVFLLKKT